MRVSFKEFQDYVSLPFWYTEDLHIQVMVLMNNEEKLKAVKLLNETSKEKGDHHRYALRECKILIMDKLISLYQYKQDAFDHYEAELDTFITHCMIPLEDFKTKIKVILPSWYDEKVHTKVVQLVYTKDKLQACKYLMDLSKENNTKTVFDLRWSKNEVVDLIADLLDNSPDTDLVARTAALIYKGQLTGIADLLMNVPKREIIKFVDKNT